MNTRVLIRWLVAMVIAFGVIGAIGQVLNSAAQARAALVFDWPGLLPPCNTPSLQQCIDAAVIQPGDTIHIKPGVYTQSVTLNKPVSLVGNNAQTTILNAEPFQRVLTVTGNITSSTIISGLTLAQGNLAQGVCPDACGGGILLSGPARPLLQNITLAQNSADQGGGLWADPGPDVRLINVAFISNAVNGLSAYGGGAFINGPVQLNGGRFVGNSGNGEFPVGGGLYAMGASISGTQFLSNTLTGSSSYGGGMYLSSGPSELFGVTLIGNRSTWGGGIYAGGTLSLTDGVVLSNTALNYGGGVYGNSGILAVTRGRYESNTAGLSGGALYASGPLTLIAAEVSHNSAADGGGVYAMQPVVVDHSKFFDNQAAVAAGRGGALYVASALDLNSTMLVGNSAAYGGGVYHDLTGDARVVNTVFARNQAQTGSGAALNLNSTDNVIILHTTIGDLLGNPGQAIEAAGGTLGITDTIIVSHATAISATNASAYEDYNLFFGNGVNLAGAIASGGNDLTSVDPQFADPFNDDYHLRFSSPAINNGIDAGVAVDFDGQPRPIGPGFDIGFDETGSTIQESIDFTPPSGIVPIPPGVYIESLNLYKPVSLIGAGNTATIIQAVAGDRVLTATGPMTAATQIANLTLTGGDVSGGGFERAGGGVLITDTAYPSFHNVQIISNSADFGGGLYVYSGGAILNDTVVANNHATQSGGGAYVVEPTAVLEQIGGAIQNNTAADGAGVFVQSGQFRQNGGVILNNTAVNLGGGLLIGSGGKIRTDFAQIVGNNAQIAGGGVLVDVGSAELFNSLIMSNTAIAGGGLYVRDLGGTSASLIGGKVEGNAATAYGGGVYAGGALYITGTRFFNNSAADGSALEITGTAQARVVNAFIAGNDAHGVFPSTNASVRFDSSNTSVVLNTTFGNAAQPLTRALAVNSGVVTVANTIVATYTNGLSQFGGRLAEDYNLFFGLSITTSGSISYGGHSLVGLDPQFKGAALGDYHIKGLSPAVNRGTNVGVRRDIDQDARPLGGAFDIGADEASVADTIAGPNIGGSFTYTTMQNSTINVNVPAGAVSQTASIYCSLIDTATLQPPRRFKFVGVVFELDANVDPVNVLPGSIDFNMPVTLSVSYTDAELAAAGITNELTLQLYRFEPLLGDWKPVGYRPNETQTLDVNNNLITATVLGFSRWGQLGASGVQDIFLPLIMRGN